MTVPPPPIPVEWTWVYDLCVGQTWPQADEDALRRCAQAWTDALQGLVAIADGGDTAAARVNYSVQSVSSDEFSGYWDKYTAGDDSVVGQMARQCEILATQLLQFAEQTEFTKLSIDIQLVILLIQLAIDAATAFLTAGATTAEGIAAALFTRMTIQRFIWELVKATVFAALPDIITQAVMLADGHRASFNGMEAFQAAQGGFVGGLIGMGVGGALAKTGLSGFFENRLGGLIGGAATSAITGAATNLLTNAATGGLSALEDPNAAHPTDANGQDAAGQNPIWTALNGAFTGALFHGVHEAGTAAGGGHFEPVAFQTADGQPLTAVPFTDAQGVPKHAVFDDNNALIGTGTVDANGTLSVTTKDGQTLTAAQPDQTATSGQNTVGQQGTAADQGGGTTDQSSVDNQDTTDNQNTIDSRNPAGNQNAVENQNAVDNHSSVVHQDTVTVADNGSGGVQLAAADPPPADTVAGPPSVTDPSGHSIDGAAAFQSTQSAAQEPVVMEQPVEPAAAPAPEITSSDVAAQPPDQTSVASSTADTSTVSTSDNSLSSTGNTQPSALSATADLSSAPGAGLESRPVNPIAEALNAHASRSADTVGTTPIENPAPVEYPAPLEKPSSTDNPAHPGAENVINAAAVPGSDFRGHGEPPSQALVDEIRGRVEAAMTAVGQGHGTITGFEVVDRERGVYRFSDSLGTFKVRVETQRLADETAARSRLNHSKGVVNEQSRNPGEHVIQISDRLAARHVERAVAHEIGEIIADRIRFFNLHTAAFEPTAGVLHEGESAPDPVLTPHDMGRIQELRVLGEQFDAAAAGGSVPEDLQKDAVALVEHLGLREGTPGAEERRNLIYEALAGDKNAAQHIRHIQDLLAATGGPDHPLLEQVRAAAAERKAQLDAHRANLQPDFEPPIVPGETHISLEQARELAAQAHEARSLKSERTLDELHAQWAEMKAQAAAQAEAAKAAGGDPEPAKPPYPRMRIQAGGGAALAARDPLALLIDDRGRWQSDNGSRIAQTADQLRDLRQTGFGDPYQFVAAPGERVPLEAVHYWEDSIAAQGPVIDGRVTFSVDEYGRLLAHIKPTAPGKPITVEVDGVPVIASGFPAEVLPGVDRRLGVRGAFERLSQALEAAKAPEELRASINELPWFDPASGPAALAALGYDANSGRLALLEQHNVKLEGSGAAAVETFKAIKSWQDLHSQFPERVMTGDQANLMRPEPGKMQGHYAVLGAGGTGISGVENLLALTDDTTFTMIGRTPPAGLADNVQFISVRQAHDKGFNSDTPDKPSVTKDPLPNPNASGRFTVVFDDLNLGVVTQDANTGRLNVAGYGGDGKGFDGVISALGSRFGYPEPVQALVDAAMKNHDPVGEQMLFDDDGQYLGYRLTVKGATIDVTGAASRFFPTPFRDFGREPATLPGPADPAAAWATEIESYVSQPPGPARQWAWQTATNRDAPPEGGNFDGGYVSTVTQAAHYAAWRRRGGVVTTDTIQSGDTA